MESIRFKKKIRGLTCCYFGTVAGLVLSFVSIVFRVIDLEMPPGAITVGMERYAIMLTLIAIPLALKLFAYMIKKRTFDSSEKAFRTYAKAFYIRLLIVSAFVALNELLFGVSRNLNFLWSTVVLVIVFMFCKPSFNEFSALVNRAANEQYV